MRGKVNIRKALLQEENVVEFVEEPLVDVGHLPDLIDAVAAVKCSRDGEYALVGGVDKFIVDVFNIVILRLAHQYPPIIR